MSDPAPSGLAPIVLLAYKRPLTTLQTLYSLSRCPEARDAELHVFCDGPRRDADRRGVMQTREVVRAMPWCGRVEIHESDANRGLARSVVSAVTEVCERHGRVIVLEDDLLVSRGFLAYMNEGLRRYAGDPRVMTISGHTFDSLPPAPRAGFLPVCTTWGWATWSRAWARFQPHPEGLHRLQDPAFRRSFDLDGAFDYSGMMANQLAGRMDSWGIHWWWSVHHHQGLGLFPRQTLVKNIGGGESATHSEAGSPLLRADSFDLDNEITQFPEAAVVDGEAWEAWKDLLRATRPPSGLRARARRAASKILARVVRR